MHTHPWFEPFLSSNVSIMWGARPHTSRNDGSLVNRGPPPGPPPMFQAVRELARFLGPVGLFRESGAGATIDSSLVVPAL